MGKEYKEVFAFMEFKLKSSLEKIRLKDNLSNDEYSETTALCGEKVSFQIAYKGVKNKVKWS